MVPTERETEAGERASDMTLRLLEDYSEAQVRAIIREEIGDAMSHGDLETAEYWRRVRRGLVELMYPRHPRPRWERRRR